MENEVYRPLEEKNEPDEKGKLQEDKEQAGGEQPPAAVEGGDHNESAVQFLPRDGEVKLATAKNEFVGMTKEELLRFATDPFWVRLRWIFIVLFCLLWFAMLAGAIAIVIVAPKCPDRGDPEWWKNGVLYYMDVRSFKDSDGDGIGDLNGIKSKVGYLKDLGVRGVWLSPIFKCDRQNLYYSVTDFKALDDDIGTMETFEALADALHGEDMKLVVEFIPNHTSRLHKWFELSENKTGPYTDYYMWTDRPRPIETWWKSTDGSDAWSLGSNARSNEYYYHAHQDFMPDLNLSNPDVQKELKDVLKFWMDKKVDGFHVDSAMLLFEQPVGEQLINPPTPVRAGSSQMTDATVGRPESFEQVKKWQEYVKSYMPDSYMLRTVISDSEPSFASLQAEADLEAVISPSLVDLDLTETECRDRLSSVCLSNNVDNWLKSVNGTKMITYWEASNQPSRRIFSRVNDPSQVPLINTIRLLLPGSSVTYYGEEIAMHDTLVEEGQGRDTFVKNLGRSTYAGLNRDFQRGPMAWNDEESGGFGPKDAAKGPWLALPDNYKDSNVKVQAADPRSALNIYKRVMKLRSSDLFKEGTVKIDQPSDGATNTGIFSFIRSHGSEKNLVMTSFADGARYDDGNVRSMTVASDGSSQEKKILLGIGGFFNKSMVDLGNLVLNNGDGIVVQL